MRMATRLRGLTYEQLESGVHTLYVRVCKRGNQAERFKSGDDLEKVLVRDGAL